MYKNIESYLQCPMTGEKLFYVESISEVNDIFHTTDLKIKSGFLNQSESILYPIKNGIICLLPEYAISEEKYYSDENILKVKKFYDDFGWTKNNEGVYYDNKLFIDQRNVGKEYKIKCSNRITNLLSNGGELLLDIASGPVYQDSYKKFGNKFKYRICIDISIEALMEAKNNLVNYKTFFILGDITNIPFKSNTFDNVISMHTLYHVPKDKQKKAFNELFRVSQTGKNKVIISYNWGWHSILMNIALFPTRIIRLFQRIQKIIFPNSVNNKSGSGLYFYSHSPKFFTKNKPKNMNIKIRVLRSIHENFIKLYIRDNKLSISFLKALYRYEDKFPIFFWETRCIRIDNLR